MCMADWENILEMFRFVFIRFKKHKMVKIRRFIKNLRFISLFLLGYI